LPEQEEQHQEGNDTYNSNNNNNKQRKLKEQHTTKFYMKNPFNVRSKNNRHKPADQAPL